MTATMSATTSATSEALAEWVKIFPRQVTETYTSSVTFMKQLTVVAVSTITYLKNVFPEESYTSERFGGVNLKVLKKKCRDELAQFLSTSLTQAFEAFDKKYLHRLALCIYDGEYHADNLMEYYMFEFTYNGDAVAMSMHSKNRDNVKSSSSTITFENIRDRTIHLVRACVVVMQTCQYELPPTFDISLRLYYNDAAPEGYQAAGFAAPTEECDQLSPTAAEAVKLGWVETPFHRLVARSYARRAPPSSHEANASLNPPIMTQNEGDGFSSPNQLEPPRSRCPCNKPCGDDDEETLTCDYCGTEQHAACFGVRSASVTRHCCARCADVGPTRTPTCRTLHDMPRGKREPLCIFRRTLKWCSTAQAVELRSLADKFQLTQAKAAKLMKILQHHGVVETKPKSDFISPRKINHEQVNNVMKKFFQTEDSNSNVVDRLFAETLSQESQSDPIGAVLGPMHKISLQNENTLGKIIDNTPPDSAAEDSMLKKYREALFSSEQRMDAELPLSGSHNPVKDMATIGKKSAKRKIKEDEENKPARSGVRTKRARGLPNRVTE